MDNIRELADKVIAKYYEEKGKRSLEDILEKEVEDLKSEILKEINNFRVKKKGQKEGEDVYYLGNRDSGGDVEGAKERGFDKNKVIPNARDTVEEEYCPAKRDEKIRLYMGVCQDWKNIKECFGGICGWYPAVDKVPVQEMGTTPKMSSDSSEGEFVMVGNEKIKVEGRTLAEKLKFLRNALVKKLGIKSAVEWINNWLSKINEGSVDKKAGRIVKVGGIDIVEGVGKGVYVVASVSNVRGINKGWLKEVWIFKDGSKLLLCESDRGEDMLVREGDVIKVSVVCGKWEDGKCKSGNIKKGVLAGSRCVYKIWNHDSCEMYCCKIDGSIE